jgi:hypothetical protein
MTLTERVRSVQTREDLVAFVADLKADLEANPAAWENGDLASFLEAMATWIQDMDGYYQNTGQELSELSPWKFFADVLMAARIYE